MKGMSKQIAGGGLSSSSLSTFYVDPKAIAESGFSSEQAGHRSGIRFPPTDSDAVPCPVDLKEDINCSSLCTETQRLQISNRTFSEPRLLPSPLTASVLFSSSRQENRQMLIGQPEADQQRLGFPTTGQSLSKEEPVQIQWRPEHVHEEPEFFDVAMIYCQEDKELVNKFADLLQKFITLDCQQKPKIYRDFLDLRDGFGFHELDNFDHVLQCSSYAFVFFSRKSVNSEDLKGKCDRTMALHGSITDESCAKVIPVVTEPNLRLGCCFSAYTKISLRSLLLGDRIFDLVDVDNLEIKHLDKRLLDRIAKTLNESRAKRQHKLVKCDVSNFDTSAAGKLTKTQTELHTELIQTNYTTLVDLMNVDDGLLTFLFSNFVLSDREMEIIKAEATRYKKNERLLNTLYLKDAKSYETFVRGLSETTQDHLAQLLRDPSKKLSLH